MDVDNIHDLFHNSSYSLPTLLDKLNILFTLHINQIDSFDLNIVDYKLLEEIKEYSSTDGINLYFGKTLRDIKCVIEDDIGRKHEIFIYSFGSKKLHVNATLPCSHLINHDYESLGDIVRTFTKIVSDLSCYFHQLEQIDQLCAVMDPESPTFREDYRRIYLDDRTWLHVEVTADGLATNIHLVGNTEEWHNKLQTGLLQWDHDKNIVENILTMFELPSFSFPSAISPTKEVDDISVSVCRICLCVELPGLCGLPQPLCKNYACGVFFHRACLYQWLIACAGYQLADFGVATGLCPNCLQPIDCDEKDN
ncbi:hypothetical protein K1T71_006140 [Dendrolimus kikuchii]|uniref:Uncharacterized protein n=1 Tax=Dendrolimus kikuchii TaxID=765133 RepID=A0ACC1D446_9NEOP|nr:hypothetical protein K1T71_006140 [Dendrolimus kikuchii]